MEKMRDFLRDHGMVCAVILCACAAVLTGAWAVHTIQKDAQEAKPPVTEQAPPRDGPLPVLPPPQQGWEENEWNTGWDVAGKAEGVPEPTPAAGQRDSSQSSSGGSSAGKPGSKQEKPASPADVGSALYGPPVSGSVVQAYSGDDLVYNETLEDWRTHNGTDYACAAGSAVQAPVGGAIAAVTDGGNWGGVVEITDSEGRTWRLCGVASTMQVGQTVTCGQEVGKAAGIACEAALSNHVHLEVEKDGRYFDPAGLIG